MPAVATTRRMFGIESSKTFANKAFPSTVDFIFGQCSLPDLW